MQLLDIVRDGCPKCGDKESLTLNGWESFTTGIGYNARFNEVAWRETDHYEMKDLWVFCSNCEHEMPIMTNDPGL